MTRFVRRLQYKTIINTIQPFDKKHSSSPPALANPKASMIIANKVLATSLQTYCRASRRRTWSCRSPRTSLLHDPTAPSNRGEAWSGWARVGRTIERLACTARQPTRIMRRGRRQPAEPCTREVHRYLTTLLQAPRYVGGGLASHHQRRRRTSRYDSRTRCRPPRTRRRSCRRRH